MVVIIIIGILAAIALPSFLNQANKARQSEAQTYIGAMNRGQQVYYLENREFATELGSLDLGLSNTENYEYTIEAPTPRLAVTNFATPTDDAPDLVGYSGGVWLGTADDSNATTLSRICPGTPGVTPPCAPNAGV